MSTPPQRLYQAQRQFLGIRDRKVPYIIGVAGSVAVGKSTTARVLQALLARWSPRPKVDLVTTDGFLFPNAVLERQGLMQKKGFPESYDLPTLLSFLSDIKAGRRPVRAPVYSHLTYDIVPNQWIEVDRPDILIVEGVNVLQTGRLPRDGKAVPVVSDFFDFSVYIDADEPVLREWYVRRFLALRDTAFTDPKSYFHRYALLSDEEATATAIAIWERTNLANLEDNILPTRPRATLILKKGADHRGRDGGAAAAVASIRRVGKARLRVPTILLIATEMVGTLRFADPTDCSPHAAMCRDAARPASASASFSRSSGLIRNPSMPASKQA